MESPTPPDDPLALAQSEFDLEPGLIYLNHAALGPWPARTVRAIQAFAAENGRTASRGWKQWYAAEQRLRTRIARTIGAPDPGDIALLKNTSEALSLIAFGLDWRPGQRMAVLGGEFPSNLWPWQEAAKQHGFIVDLVQPRPGQAAHEALIGACRPQTRLVSVSSVQWATGEAVDVEALGGWCEQHDVLLVVDAIQSLGALATDVARGPIDALASGSHKWLLAPEGVGLLYCSARLRDRLQPRQAGWRMCRDPFSFEFGELQPAADARRLEIGTLNTQGIIGLDASLSLYEALGPEWVENRVLELARYLHTGLAAIRGLALALPQPVPSGILSFSLRDADRDSGLFTQLSTAGVMLARRCGWLRCSPHYHNTIEQLDCVLDIVTAAAD